jgi:hypothetical protein
MHTISRFVVLGLLTALALGSVGPQALAQKRGGNDRNKQKKKDKGKYAYDVVISVLAFQPSKKWDTGLDGKDEYIVDWSVASDDGKSTFAGSKKFTEVDKNDYKTINQVRTFKDIDPDQMLTFNVSAREDGLLFDKNMLDEMPSVKKPIRDVTEPQKFAMVNAHYQFFVQYTVTRRKKD